MKKKLVSLILAAVMVLAIVSSVFAAEVTASGTCGDDLTWVLTEGGTLTIQGTGEMNEHPWSDKCDSITSVIIKSGVTSICESAFENCEYLASIKIPDSVTSIGERAFGECYSLTSITIPHGVTYIGNVAFSGCVGLTGIDVAAGNERYTSLNGVLFDKDKTVLIQYPAGKSETDYIIPDSVASIGDGAFEYCYNLTGVTIPGRVTSIGQCAFNGCDTLSDVYYGGSEDEWNLININDYGNDPIKDATIHFNYVPSEPEIVSVSAEKKNGTVKVTVETKDLSAENKVIAVCYGEGEEYIAAKETDTSGNAEFNAEGVKTVKVFLWESLESMKPLCEAKVIEIK